MKNIEIVGIDVSKKTLDIHLLSKKKSYTVNNGPDGFFHLIQTCADYYHDLSDVFFCFEETGRYSKLLSIFLYDAGYKFAALNALDLKRSLGLTRGKTDKKDACAIAQYAWRKRDELSSTILPSAIMDQLKSLLSLREMLVKHRTAYKNASKDLHDCYFEGEYDFIKESQNRTIQNLNQELKEVEGQLLHIIHKNPALLSNYKLLLSVKGIGKVLAIYLITLTENFTKFSNPKKFACYAGIAPFPYTSGTSIKGRTKLHNCANKQIKSLLNVAAMSAIQQEGEFKSYFLRRTEEGKNKMSTLNIIRNKIVYRAFAVIKRKTSYIDVSKFAA